MNRFILDTFFLNFFLCVVRSGYSNFCGVFLIILIKFSIKWKVITIGKNFLKVKAFRKTIFMSIIMINHSEIAIYMTN